jgi:hypothetical protein
LHVVGDAIVTGIITATTFAGLATHATRLATSRNFSVVGDIESQTIPFDGTDNVGFGITLSNTFSANTSGIITASILSGNVQAPSSVQVGSGGAVLLTLSGIQASSGIATVGTAIVGFGVTINSTGINASGIVTATTINSTGINASGIITATSAIVGSAVTINSGGVDTVGVITATDFNSTSDASLKENVTTVSDALSTTKELRGVRFEWKKDGKPSYGVIAQELEQILPELVSDTDPKTVNYNGIIGILIEAVKELSQRVEDLENKS